MEHMTVVVTVEAVTESGEVAATGTETGQIGGSSCGTVAVAVAVAGSNVGGEVDRDDVTLEQS
jgi:hypothetical protein